MSFNRQHGIAGAYAVFDALHAGDTETVVNL